MNTNLFKEAIADADAIKKMAIENAKASLNEAFDTKIKSMLAARLEEEADDVDPKDMGDEDESYLGEKKSKEEDSDEEGSDHEKVEEKSGKEDSDDEADEAFDLDEIIAELEKSGDDGQEGEDEAYDAEDEAYEESDEAYEEDQKEAVEDEDEAYDAKEDGENKDMDEEIDIAALLSEMEDEEDNEKMKEEEEEPEEKDEVKALEEEMMGLLEKMKMAKKAKMMKKSPEQELQEIKRQAAVLTQKVNETNLINAKLLYLNKILRKYNLSEQQKLKVIGAFDKATTTKEAKIVHESLDQAFSVKNDNIKTGLKESIGFASKAAGTSTKRVINEGVISDADKQVSRWQKLAGIIK